MYGNQLAARRAPIDAHVVTPNIRVDAKSNICLHLNSFREGEWCSSVVPRAIIQFFPRPPGATALPEFLLPYYSSQILSGHSKLNCFVHLINLVHALVDDTINHFVAFFRPSFRSLRNSAIASSISPSSQSLCSKYFLAKIPTSLFLPLNVCTKLMAIISFPQVRRFFATSVPTQSGTGCTED